MLDKLILLFLSFFKIGAVSFGGGYGMLALMREEALNFGISEGEFMNFLAVSESTPGPIAVNMATFIGSSQAGILGAACATLGVVLPAFIIILLIVTVLKNLMQMRGVQAAIKGIHPVVVALILSTGITLLVSTALGFSQIGDTITPDWITIISFVVVVITNFLYKKLTQKKISPILLIVISAILGMLLSFVF